jgi:predicted transcriptional regulator of viral defense system
MRYNYLMSNSISVPAPTAGYRRRALAMIRDSAVVRPRDLDAHGVPRHYLQVLHEEGAVERIGRGLYVAVNAEASEHHALAEATVRVPHGIVCLLSALRFHEITTQQPHRVWMAIEDGAWQPRVAHPPIRFARFSGASWTWGVERHTVEGVPIRVFSPAKTVADCFKYRNKIGIDVAVEALRETLRGRRATVDELLAAAAACRMTRVMTPYLEALG